LKTIIIYATKYGSTKKSSELLAHKIGGETVVVDVNKNIIPQLNGFDKIVIATSIKMGMADKMIKQYCKENEKELIQGNTFLLICAGSGDKIDEAVKLNFSAELVNGFKCVQYVGGEMNANLAKGIDKMILKMATADMKKNNKPFPTIIEENVENLAKIILA